ncbi:MAG TPA: alpha/beta hydrolase [Phytomonospora sp.]
MAETRTIQTSGGLAFHTRTWGPVDAEPLLLLHGVSADGSAWDPVVAALSDRWRVHVPDMRGHGRSSWPGEYSFELMRDDVLALMDALGLPSAAVAGHSMGGVAGYLAATAKPERVTGLVLVETPPPVPIGVTVPPRPEEELDYDWDLRPRIIAQLNAPPAEWWEGLPSITARTLVIGGGATSFLPQDRIREMAGRIPRGRFAEIPVGHLVVAAAPVELAAAIDGLP